MPELNNTQTIFQYHAQNTWSEVEEVLRSLLDFIGTGDQADSIKINARNVIDFLGLDLTEKERKVYQAIVALLDLDKAKRIINNPDDAVMLKEMERQLKLLSAALGLNFNDAEYTYEEIGKFFEMDEIKFDWAKMFYTCNLAFKGQDAEHYVETFLVYLTLDPMLNHDNFTWEEALFYTLMIQVIWSHFPFMYGDDQVDFIQTYFYRGIVVGANVRSALEDSIYNLSDIYDFIIFHASILETMKGNKEIVSIDLKNEKYEKLASIITKQVINKTTEEGKGYSEQEYIRDLYQNQPKRDAYVRWLLEVFYIISHIQTTTLVKFSQLEDYKRDDEVETYDAEVLQLISWFFTEETWDKIVEYYKQPNPRVPLKVILYHCSKDFDLDKQSAVDTFVKFNDYLKEEQILKEDQDIIEFHEEDSKFHWADWII